MSAFEEFGADTGSGATSLDREEILAATRRRGGDNTSCLMVPHASFRRRSDSIFRSAPRRRVAARLSFHLSRWRYGWVCVVATFLSDTLFAQNRHDGHEHHHPPSAVRQSPPQHIPPDPPQSTLPDMSNERMIELMGMDDNAPHSMLMFDQLEWRDTHGRDVLAWDIYGWYGNDYDKVWLKFEGEYFADTYAARYELLWDRIVSRWWSVQAGVRHDILEGPSRTWAAIGLQGLAPYWFEVEATAYVGEEGRTAMRLSIENEVLLTQRLVLQPEIEIDAYGKSDPANRIGSGISSVGIGLRLRYEIRRELAPYLGMQFERKLGQTEDLAVSSGRDSSDTTIVAGVRVWF